MALDALLAKVLGVLEDMKAEDVVTIPLAGKTSVCDVMVVASGRSTRQVAAMADRVATALKTATGTPPSIEGQAQADWVLIDGGDIVVHLFRPEVRQFYNLEKMWGVELPGGDATTREGDAPGATA